MNSIISKMFKVKFVTIFCIFILLCMLSINTGQCRPERHRHRQGHKLATTTPAPENNNIYADADAESKIQHCYKSSKTMDLCQRCAKETKAENVFPLCCSNESDVQSWCKSYLEFGL